MQISVLGYRRGAEGREVLQARPVGLLLGRLRGGPQPTARPRRRLAVLEGHLILGGNHVAVHQVARPFGRDRAEQPGHPLAGKIGLRGQEPAQDARLHRPPGRLGQLPGHRHVAVMPVGVPGSLGRHRPALAPVHRHVLAKRVSLFKQVLGLRVVGDPHVPAQLLRRHGVARPSAGLLDLLHQIRQPRAELLKELLKPPLFGRDPLPLAAVGREREEQVGLHIRAPPRIRPDDLLQHAHGELVLLLARAPQAVDLLLELQRVLGAGLDGDAEMLQPLLVGHVRLEHAPHGHPSVDLVAVHQVLARGGRIDDDRIGVLPGAEQHAERHPRRISGLRKLDLAKNPGEHDGPRPAIPQRSRSPHVFLLSTRPPPADPDNDLVGGALAVLVTVGDQPQQQHAGKGHTSRCNPFGLDDQQDQDDADHEDDAGPQRPQTRQDALLLRLHPVAVRAWLRLCFLSAHILSSRGSAGHAGRALAPLNVPAA